MTVDLKRTGLYALITHHWIGNHNYTINLDWLVCDEEPDTEMVKRFFKETIGYTEVYSIQKFDYNKVDDGGFWLGGNLLEWTNDYDVMIREQDNRWHDAGKEKNPGCMGRISAEAWPF